MSFFRGSGGGQQPPASYARVPDNSLPPGPRARPVQGYNDPGAALFERRSTPERSAPERRLPPPRSSGGYVTDIGNTWCLELTTETEGLLG